jgi:hypothetical protein
MYTPKSLPDQEKGGDGAAAAQAGPPLRFFTSARSWDPPSVEPEYRHLPLIAPSRDPNKAGSAFEFSVQDRVFPGFYEPGADTPRRAAFWFENRNPKPVVMQLLGVSCTACSGGRLAAIPPEVTRRHLHRTALAALPVGTFHAFGVGLADPAAELDRLDWTAHKYRDNPNAAYRVPAAPEPPDTWAPQWGILELTFTVKESKVLTAGFALQVEGGTEPPAKQDFVISYATAEACSVSRPAIDVGEINPLTGDREYQFLVYSATRGPGSEFGDLAPPVCAVQAAPGQDPGPFLAVTRVERVPDGELFEVAAETAKNGQLTKVQAAYRVTVAVRPKVGEARLDLGALDRTVFMTVGTATAAVKVVGTVRGAVWLGNGKTGVELPTFKGRLGTVHTPELVTESAGTDLTVVADESKPRFFKFELVRKPDRGGQGYYDLRITGAAGPPVRGPRPGRGGGAGSGPGATAPGDRSGGRGGRGRGRRAGVPPTPQRIRLPIRGSGEQG